MTKALLSMLSLIMLLGCSASEEVETVVDEFDEIRKIAWDFVIESGWGMSSADDWQSADVKEVVVGDHYELLEDSYRGKAVLKVSFIDMTDALVTTPEILVDPDAGKVVGYLIGE